MKRYCHSKTDVPKTKHYAILTFGSITIPGDERSRTAPGHGYPEHSESTAEYIAFDNREEWETEIASMSGKFFQSHDFVALVVEPAKITTEIKVKVDP